MARTETYDDTVKPRSGISLAKGPVAMIGIASLVFGVLGFIFANQSFTFDIPDGTVNGDTFLGVEGNGWTWTAFAAAGLLLLLGSPVHWGAKSMAFIVGVVMIVGALIAISDGTDILGIIATNNWTKLIMGAMGGVLVLLAMMPRVGQRRGGAPMTTRHERDDTRDDVEQQRRFERDRDHDTTAPVEPANGRATTTRGPLEDRR
ncbi:hypothetical protein OJ997_33775 [Solirubrobacter phytolaccae]|uniref:DUF4383 domain-containing protein n=1 Tax=Solirubrobacter phytolaccae TaxID=1404360 RepID=A0A9X3NFM4_9ACTN|nr:hypothetical protein [Solirubrobacter phytolaccae]MDA0185324.1 hypothetical protein [Solirubrobacter phytolaccae]